MGIWEWEYNFLVYFLEAQYFSLCTTVDVNDIVGVGVAHVLICSQ